MKSNNNQEFSGWVILIGCFIMLIIFIIGALIKLLDPEQLNQTQTKIEYKPVKADSVYDDNEQPVFDYWIEIDSNRFK